ncbi:helix-turn-helix transcriptional regulator [Phytoactinopolyspora halotolerans]|uniref:Helix-turn-helix domain-containing protein n=1 Tax=Phytoactinopolyspora halotolerans TaxID=1981512 RepID=A0A6L9SGG1_9ACTN|nr:helix-turn-helix transcriptional regulator [Phytoactinopolyspora halotolerans]NEE04346.1 helix-turn-helix domain-containing protein [Phytoactinopolyspora halotolerans]
MSTTVDLSRELAAFLRSRRERLTPADTVLPRHRRARRTPGLRREEVAELAGVSVDYVVRLEQARGLRPSPEVLDALADALQLDDDERTYLFDLAQQRPGPRRRQPRPPEPAAGPLARMAHDLSPLPAMVLNHRLDIVAWNPQMPRLMGLDFDAIPGPQRNAIWLCIHHPTMRDFYVDREQIIREGIADLRAAWASRPDDTGLAALIEELSADHPDFARFWDERDVRVNAHGRKRVRHPVAGLIEIEFDVLTPLHDHDQRLVVYRAADTASQAALATAISSPDGQNG